ncbi:hypothetical protein CAter282_4614 [Collimonas arenae]|uniref:Uncharacterized protein n=1 Tax=Collimonas arenae TaxID=279058 RepID=A0A127PXC4_9BURK|nr:hypothetical protein CAter10_5018 [Collimonas arenae]AMP12269.1 hypothetical protein CAter282_4614 [Collimonas arenae]
MRNNKNQREPCGLALRSRLRAATFYAFGVNSQHRQKV